MALTLEILISTKDRTDTAFLKEMFPGGLPKADILIINQTGGKKGIPLSALPPRVRVVHSNRYGLSHSRNLALTHARGDILLLADDDVRYRSGFEKDVMEAHEKYDAPFLIFPIADEKGQALGLHLPADVPVKDFTQVFSPQISMKRMWIKEKDIRYDENFGLGARYPDSENFVFLKETAQAGGEVRYVATSPIAIHPRLNSSDFLENDGVFETRMVLFKKYHNPQWLWLYFFKVLGSLLVRGRLSLKDLPGKWRLFRKVAKTNFD